MEREHIEGLLKELCAIPAPSDHEEKRAEFCKNYLLSADADNVYIDDTRNVRFLMKGDSGKNEDRPVVVFMAHMDTVFPDMEPMPYREEEERLYCPGIGDDTANLTLMLLVIEELLREKARPKDVDILFVCNAGEEGLGNLKGTRKIVEDYRKRIREFYSVDGTAAGYSDLAVGSHRYKISMKTEGGHSYGNFGNRNAIVALAAFITDLYNIKPACCGRVTWNVGTIEGGTSVNSIAAEASCSYEYRSDVKADLEFMKKHLMKLAEAYQAKGVDVNIELIGDRPCGRRISGKKTEKLLKRVLPSIVKFFPGYYENYDPLMYLHPGSTDCNIPLSEGIPSLCFGCYIGGGAHTREEWVSRNSLLPGFNALDEIIRSYFV